MIAEALPNKDVTKMEKHVFRVYDSNMDGAIDFVEFMVVFHILSGRGQKKFICNLFSIITYGVLANYLLLSLFLNFSAFLSSYF